MKKLVLALALVFGMGTSAQALEFAPYVGADVGMNVIPSEITGLNYVINAGVKTKFFGVEAYYSGNEYNNDRYFTHTIDTTQYPHSEFSSEYFSLGLDLVGYLPLGEKFNILASVGYAYFNYDEEIDLPDYIGTSTPVLIPDPEFKQHKHGARVGLGAMYEVYKNVDIRLMARYTIVEMGSFEKISNPLAVTIGARYTFK